MNKLITTFTGVNSLTDSNTVSFELVYNSNTYMFAINWVAPTNNLDDFIVITEESLLANPNEVIAESYQSTTLTNYDAINYTSALERIDNLDLFTVNRINNKVEIKANFTGIIFKNYTSTSNDVTFNYSVDAGLDNLQILDFLTIQGDCETITYDLQFNESTVDIVSPIQEGDVGNPYQITLERGVEHNLVFTASGDRYLSQLVTPLSKLTLDNFIVNVVGDIVSLVYKELFSDLELEFSVDGINYFNNQSVFTGLVNGDYTAYVKDKFGCILTKQFKIADEEKEPYFLIPKSNPIRFYESKEWDNVNSFKTDENTSSCNELGFLNYKGKQLYQTNDIITTQFRSNYTKHVVKARSKTKEYVVPVTTVKKLANITDVRTGKFYKISNVEAGLYFSNGELPFWYKKDSIVLLDGIGGLKISRLYFDYEKNKKVAVFDIIHLQGTIDIQATTTYNARPYNVFEFKTIFANFNNEDVEITLEVLENDKVVKTFKSELINVKDKQENCLELLYFDVRNGDLLYAETEDKNLLRVPFEDIVDSSSNEVEIHRGDTDFSQITSEYTEQDQFKFTPQTKEIARVLELALIHPFVYINKSRRILSEKVEKERVEETNLYKVSANLIKVAYEDEGLKYFKDGLVVPSNINTYVPDMIELDENEYLFFY